MKFFAALGRICFALIFLFAGISKILNWSAAEQALVNGLLNVLQNMQGVQWVQQVLDLLLPHVPELLFAAAAAEIFGGALIFLGLSVRFGAAILAIFLIPTTLIFHHFWWLQGSERELQLLMFLKNLALFGACLLFMAQGKGAPKGKPQG